jgi:type II secretory pathway pseudopilin PulG
VAQLFKLRMMKRPQVKNLRYTKAFTLLELLIVISIIIILAGLTIATMGYVQDKAKRSRAEAEVAAISAALESYKADNGVYPRDTTVTDGLDARTGLSTSTELNPDPTKPNCAYTAPSLFLYKSISGDSNANHQVTAKSYLSVPTGLVWPRSSATIGALVDPFGNCYGYSTANQTAPDKGFNPTFDLWSTAGSGTGATPTPSPAPTPVNLWIKNW